MVHTSPKNSARGRSRGRTTNSTRRGRNPQATPPSPSEESLPVAPESSESSSSLPEHRLPEIPKRRQESNQQKKGDPLPDTDANSPSRHNNIQEELDYRKEFYLFSCCSENQQKNFNTEWSCFWLSLMIPIIVGYCYTSERLSFTLFICKFTVWSYFTTCAFLISSVSYGADAPEKTSFQYHLHRILHSLSLVCEVVVITFYWPFAYEADIKYYEEQCRHPVLCYFFTAASHGLVLVPILSVLIFQRVDIRLLDYFFLLGYGVAYSIAIYLYSKLSRPVYLDVDFSKSSHFLMLGMVWAYSALVFLVVYLEAWGRECWLQKRLKKEKEAKEGLKKRGKGARKDASDRHRVVLGGVETERVRMVEVVVAKESGAEKL